MTRVPGPATLLAGLSLVSAMVASGCSLGFSRFDPVTDGGGADTGADDASTSDASTSDAPVEDSGLDAAGGAEADAPTDSGGKAGREGGK